MSDLRLVVYKGNREPRSFALSTRTVYKTFTLATLLSLITLVSIGVAARFYILAKAKTTSQPIASSGSHEEITGPTNNLVDQNRFLKDQVDALEAKLKNASAIQATPKEIDKRNPALGLFAPIVQDRTQSQQLVVIKNFKYSAADAKTPATLTFELHNAEEQKVNTQKGYIVVLGRTENDLKAYPNVFNSSGPYLIDFEKGETFQVQRFRFVNAQFQFENSKIENLGALSFQILIFTRSGELLINQTYEVKNGSSNSES